MTSDSKRSWFILDGITQIQSQPLSDEKLEMVLKRISEHEHDRFFIWTNSWENWQPIKLFLKSDKNIFNQPAKVEENSITKSSTHIKIGDNTLTGTSYRAEASQKDTDMNQIEVHNIKAPQNIDFKKLTSKEAYKQRQTRHDLKIEVLLISKKGKSFRSHSKNISLSGTLLEDNIPFDYYGCIFDIVVVNRYAKEAAHSRVQIKGRTIGDGVSRRIEFEPLPKTTGDKLEMLLSKYLENQKDQAS